MTSSSEFQHWLVETKFHAPLLREDVLPRPGLIDELNALAASHPLTLISAPAGYGKTTLLASFRAAYPELASTWMSLDEDDNDPVKFLSALIAALRQLNPRSGDTAKGLITGLPNPRAEVRRLMSVLINDILETLPDPFALILDDLHVITEPDIYAGLNFLLDHIPPQMHLVVSSRHEPALALARLRARGMVGEMRLDKLRFSIEEAANFLVENLGLILSPAETEILFSRTEGWAAGLRLLAGSLEHITSAQDRKKFIQHLSQHERHIFDFLAEEVFSHQEPDVRDFLLKTAILSELTTPLCQAVTGRNDAGVILEELYKRNLLLEEAASRPGQGLRQTLSPQLNGGSSTQPVYRYHDLFAEFLRVKLNQEKPQLVSDLHLRAAQAESDPITAIGHYLAAARWLEAAELIEQVGAEMFAFGYIETLNRWIITLPTSVRESHPRLLHYLSNCALWKGTWPEVEELLQRALQGFEAAGDEAGQGEVLAGLATNAMIQRDYEKSGSLFDRALAFPIPPHIRLQCLLGRAGLRMDQGDWPQAQNDFEAAMVMVREGGKIDLIDLVTFPYFDAGFAFLPGGLGQLEHICKQAMVLIGQEVSPLRLVVEELGATLYLFRGQLAEAIEAGERALALRERLGGHPFLEVEADVILAVAHAIQGDYAAADEILGALFQDVEPANSPTIDVADLLYGIGRIRWLQGRAPEVREIYDQMNAYNDPRGDFPVLQIYRAWLWSLLEISEGRFAEAERALRQPEVLDQRDRRSTMSGSTRLMLARLYLQQNRREEALAELGPVLEYHERLGVPFAIMMEGQSIVPLLRLATDNGVYASYAAHLLDLLGSESEPRPVYVPNTGETLTTRETEILRLILAGYGNQDIADELVISVWTVKSHLTRVYGKLDVSSRTQAAFRARELGLG